MLSTEQWLCSTGTSYLAVFTFSSTPTTMHFCAKLILILAFLFLIPCSANNVTSSTNSTGLLNAFRLHYEQFHTLLISVYAEATDPFLLQLLGEDLEEFSRTVDQVLKIFHFKLGLVNS